MLYATLKTIHLLASIVWLGGMFFMLACLRPSLGVLDAPLRPRLMAAAMQRFFAAVAWVAAAMLASGAAMIASGIGAGGGAAVRGVHTMAALGIVMVGVFVYVRVVPYERLRRAVGASPDAPAAAAALNTIRRLVMLNLAIGVVIVAITQFAAAI